MLCFALPTSQALELKSVFETVFAVSPVFGTSTSTFPVAGLEIVSSTSGSVTIISSIYTFLPIKDESGIIEKSATATSYVLSSLKYLTRFGSIVESTVML